MGTNISEPVTLTSKFDLFFENFYFANNFATVSARALISHMNIFCDIKIFLLTLTFDLFKKNYIGHDF